MTNLLIFDFQGWLAIYFCAAASAHFLILMCDKLSMDHDQQPTLVVGSTGVIGAALFQKLRQQGNAVIGTTRYQDMLHTKKIFLDLAVKESIDIVLKQAYRSAVICSGITSVQACQADPKGTRKINVDATISLLQSLSSANIRIIYLSTSLVYDGSLCFVESSQPTCPSTEYGLQKCIVESYLLNEVKNATIIRFGKVLEPTHPLFLGWHSMLLNNQEIYPFSDKRLAPVSLQTAIDILAWLNHDLPIGLFQATACSEITYADAAYILARLAKCDQSLVKPMHSLSCHRIPVCHTTLRTSEEITGRFGKILPRAAIEYVYASINSHPACLHGNKE